MATFAPPSPSHYVLLQCAQQDTSLTLQHGLESQGMSTMVATDASARQRLMQCTRFDILVLDLASCGGDPLGLSRHLRETGMRSP